MAKIMIYDTGIGIIPFIQRILKEEKKNDYFLYMDEDVFPIGKRNKDFIIQHLKFILSIANRSYDILVLACNSISSYLQFIDLSCYQIKIYSIFEFNMLLMDENTTFLGTSASSKNVINFPSIALDKLPALIEHNEVIKIIELIGKLHFKTPKVVLGCTHFPHIKFIFEDLFKDITFLSNENAIVDLLPNDEHLSFKGNAKAKRYLNEYTILSNKILCA